MQGEKMKPDELKTGHVYFTCGWSNPKYPIPSIETYVYIGQNLYEHRADMTQNEYIFEIPDKYFEQEILNGLTEDQRREYETPEEPHRVTVREDSLGIVRDIDGLIDFLILTKKQPNAKDLL